MRDGLPWIRRVPYPDKDGRYRYGVDPCLPWSRCLELVVSICIRFTTYEGQYGLGPLLLGRGGCLWGLKLPQPYTGKGVIVGVVDQGLDFTLTQISMTKRVKRIVSNKFGTKRVLIVKRNTGRKRNCWMRLARLIRM